MKEQVMMRAERTMVERVRFVTGCSFQEALDQLADADWNLQEAIDCINRVRGSEQCHS